MKILMYTSVFAPQVGGIEQVSQLLAEEFTRQGHELRLLTATSSTSKDNFPFEVIRTPSPRQVRQQLAWCDLSQHACISLQAILPFMISKKPLVVTHHTWYQRPSGRKGWQDHLKRLACRGVWNISVSKAIANALPVTSTIIGNPYADHVFTRTSTKQPDQDLIFVGRLVSDKGCALLLQALNYLHERNYFPKLTIIGTGSDLSALQLLTDQLRVADQVEFKGVLEGQQLAEELRRHRILVVPSLWNEPFGLVALEAIASGCAVIGSSGGGLPEAIGPCGVTFPNGSWEKLADCIYSLSNDTVQLLELQRPATGHLANFTRQASATKYLNFFEGILK